MKLATATLLAFAVLTGCHSGPRPDAGLAALRVKVVAEPKAGVQPPPAAVSTHDTPSDQSYGPHARVDYSQVDNIVVWVEPAPGAPAAKMPATKPLDVTVDPRKSSHGIDAVVCVGQTIVLHNAGDKAQDIYSVSDGNDFELAAVPASGVGRYEVRSPGLIEIFADSSKDIAVQLFATPTPWAQVTRSGETVDFNNIPPGSYQIVSWHPRLPGSTQPVQLTADRVTDASVKVGVNSLPKISADASR